MITDAALAEHLAAIEEIATQTTCRRYGYAARILSPVGDRVLVEDVNTPPHGFSPFCLGKTCARDQLRLDGHERPEFGCLHAEMAAICRAAADGIACADAVMVCTGSPSVESAAMIIGARISTLALPAGSDVGEGVSLLRRSGVTIRTIQHRLGS